MNTISVELFQSTIFIMFLFIALNFGVIKPQGLERRLLWVYYATLTIDSVREDRVQNICVSILNCQMLVFCEQVV